MFQFVSQVNKTILQKGRRKKKNTPTFFRKKILEKVENFPQKVEKNGGIKRKWGSFDKNLVKKVEKKWSIKKP